MQAETLEIAVSDYQDSLDPKENQNSWDPKGIQKQMIILKKLQILLKKIKNQQNPKLKLCPTHKRSKLQHKKKKKTHLRKSQGEESSSNSTKILLPREVSFSKKDAHLL